MNDDLKDEIERLRKIIKELPENCETCWVRLQTGRCNCDGDCGLIGLADDALEDDLEG
jgi:hypothetical protein